MLRHGLKYLTGPFDIHTGGVDHRQVHHPNEIAQNQGYLGGEQPGANYWLHSEFLIMQGDKMSKSSGQFWRLQTLIDKAVHPLAYRFLLLQSHYRSQLDFSLDAAIQAKVGYERILRRIAVLREQAGTETRESVNIAGQADLTTGGPLDYLRHTYQRDLSAAATNVLQRFQEAIADDLGTPKARAILTAIIIDNTIPPAEALRTIGCMDLVLGLDLLTLEPRQLQIRPADATIAEEHIEALLAERQQARAQRDWARADQIRTQLNDAGISIQDDASTDSTIWSWQPRS